MFDADKHHRRSIRWRGYDYRNAGAYFLTICAHRKQPIFGRLENGGVRLHPYGKIVAEELQRSAELRPHCILDEWIVMPNHVHAIIFIRNHTATYPQTPAESGTTRHTSGVGPPAEGGSKPAETLPAFGDPGSGSISALAGAFKASVSRRINEDRAARGWPQVKVWQRGFYERIIRDEAEYIATRRYIIENPIRSQFCAPAK